MGRTARRVGVIALLFLVVGLVEAPFIMQWISLPHSSLRLENAVEDMGRIGRLIQAFERAHGGLLPRSVGELKQFVVRDHCADEETRTALDRRGWQYYPNARPGEPVGACVLWLSDRRVLVTLDERGVVHASRVWTWPTFQMSDGLGSRE